MTLRIIGAGFGRTGTTSLQAALETLGFDKCYHMREVMKNPKHAYFWRDAVLGNNVDWLTFFEGYQATVDWPGCDYYQELMEIYPDAKVLLSVRDPERWYESTLTTIYVIPKSLLMKILSIVLPHVRTVYPIVNENIWHRIFHDRFEEKEYAIDIFNRHNEAVKQYVPVDRLLVYDVKEGWEPLCTFLGVPVPTDKPFPHLNDRILMQRAMRWGPAVIFAALGGVLALIFWLVATLIN